MICSPSFIVAYYDEWKDRIDKSNNLEDKISHMSADNTHMSCCIKLSSNLSWWDYRWLHIDDSSPHYETITQYDMDIIRSAITKESAQSFDYEFLYDDYEIHIMYEVSIGEDGKMNDKEVVNIVPVAKMNDFLLSLDKLCKTAASSFLSSSVFSNDIFKWS